MDSERRESFGSKESLENQRRNSKDNTEYVPTRCRITKPIPPKPAANPMQFVKIGPCELFRKAQEQLKKVEEVKTVTKEIKDEAEDWQANLDNWKSSRRKRQEHIIERVVEVKKFEQQESEKGRRKSKTFNEILEERNKRKNKYNISLYENTDPSDLSDYGIGLSKESNDVEQKIKITDSNTDKTDETKVVPKQPEKTTSNWNESKQEVEGAQSEPEQYTYEGAIQRYRTRVISKTNAAISNNEKKESNTDALTDSNSVDFVMPKGSILKRKELFENDKIFELNHFESNTSRRLCEDFVYSQTLKQRLLNLENKINTEQSFSSTKNNVTDQSVRSRVSAINNLCSKESENNNAIIQSNVDCSYNSPNSPEPEAESDNVLSDDNLTSDRVKNFEGLQFCSNSNYPASNSSTEQLVSSSQYGGDTDREDSGIHTADVSCSVSQADDTVDELDIMLNPTSQPPQKSVELENNAPLLDNNNTIIYDIPPTSTINSTEVDCEQNSDTNDYMSNNNIIYPINFLLEPPSSVLEPPKEKPPPPPTSVLDTVSDEPELLRINSTKRIKNEMRMKRSSFLGLETDKQEDVETVIKKPPDMTRFLQRESRLQKQMYKRSLSCNQSETGDSQDSGVELERGRLSTDTWCSSSNDSTKMAAHGRQSSEPCTTNSVTSEEDEITKKEREIIALVEEEEKWRVKNQYPTDNFNQIYETHSQSADVTKNSVEKIPKYVISEDDDEHSEVLKVEHELLQLEREELRRQRENLLFKENRMRSQPTNHLTNKQFSLEDIYRTSNQILPTDVYLTNKNDYRKSMPELQRDVPGTVPVATPKQTYEDNNHHRDQRRCTLQMLSAVPRSRLVPQDTWIHSKSTSSLLGNQRDKFNYNQHWLIQEAEQRRISEQHQKQKLGNLSQSVPNWKATRPEKHLPDSVIQTLTQRVQNKVNLADRNILNRRMDIDDLAGHSSPHSVGHALPIHHPHLVTEESQDKMLSVSGKKKCSYCGNELGRGAAMIIESLCLFYHMTCFKCCVCHVQLGDGLMGTDVRVRNNKLHCHNCYSSDDGVIFSCV